MQDVPQERLVTDAPASDEAALRVRFAGLVFDLGACTLTRESGETIALTRGEFRLLRLFVSRPGRVLSRDAILEAVANRPLELFDRSVDALVGRLRRKIELDPKAPRLIITVPGEGYRFDVAISTLRSAPVDGVAEAYPHIGVKPDGLASEAAGPDAPAELRGPPAPSWVAGAHAPRSLWFPLAATAVMAALIVAGAYGWRSGLASSFMGTATADKLAAVPRLSIVVLPFENVSGDKDQDYFADGITDDLTTDLSHVFDFVIARNTAFTYKGKPVDAKQIGRELGVKYQLEGSVRRVGETITINAQLISTETGSHVWADRFEGDRTKLGELQVEAVSRLANSLGAELVKVEALRAMRERPGNPDAVDLAMQGSAILNGTESLANINEAIGLFESALSRDPNNVQALVDLTVALIERVSDFADESSDGHRARAEQAVDAALAIQSDNSAAHFAKSLVYEIKHQWGPAIAEAEKAIAYDPNNASALAEGGFYKMFLGHAEDGLADVEAALRLSPRDPHVRWWQFYICHFHSHLAQWEQSIEWCNKSVASGNESEWPYTDLAAAHGWLGHMKEARQAAAQVLKYDPDFTIQGWMDSPLHDRWNGSPVFEAQVERIVEGARRAGIPEGKVRKE